MVAEGVVGGAGLGAARVADPGPEHAFGRPELGLGEPESVKKIKFMSPFQIFGGKSDSKNLNIDVSYVNLPGHGECRRLARHRRVEQRHGGGTELTGLK